MLKSCKYCGRIHDSKYDCGKRPVRKKMRTQQSSFRSTEAWKKKSVKIRRRDNYLCQVCIRELYGTKKQYNSENIEVHHIIPLAEGWEYRLDADKLISLCGEHHEAAEKGKIPRWVLLDIAREQEEKMKSPPVC